MVKISYLVKEINIMVMFSDLQIKNGKEDFLCIKKFFLKLNLPINIFIYFSLFYIYF